MSVDTSAPIIGIDLGTTNSLAAVLVEGEPRLIPNALGEVMTPSAVSVDERGELLVGAAALARRITHPERTATSFKAAMGTERTWELGGETFDAVRLSAWVLKSLKEDAEAHLGRPVSEAVITVPAYFGERQRRATRAAASVAGLNAERIINEPTAAAIAYGLHRLEVERRVVVVDLGGGTCDVTLLEIIEGIVEIQASAGDIQLGGDDFVAALVDHFSDARGLTDLSTTARARLWRGCQTLVHRLTSEEVAEITLPELDGREALRLALDRPQAEALWRPLRERISHIVRRALRDGAILPGAVEEILLVGGASRMPLVSELVEELFDRSPSVALSPDLAVAQGAAVQAALKGRDEHVGDLIVTDIAPFTMGVEVGRRDARGRSVSGLFSPILSRGTTIPVSRVERYGTLSDGQRGILLQVYQGEHALCAQNTHLGTLTVEPIPAAPAGHEAVDVRFTYDLNGILEVEATVVSTGAQFSAAFFEPQDHMTDDFVRAARERMSQLKAHPRDLLPNRTIIARADALFVELVGAPRELLSEALSEFQLALEGQRRGEIEAARHALSALIDALSA